MAIHTYNESDFDFDEYVPKHLVNAFKKKINEFGLNDAVSFSDASLQGFPEGEIVCGSLNDDQARDFCRAYSAAMNEADDDSAATFVVSSCAKRWVLICTKNDFYDLDMDTLAEYAAAEILRKEKEESPMAQTDDMSSPSMA